MTKLQDIKNVLTSKTVCRVRDSGLTSLGDFIGMMEYYLEVCMRLLFLIPQKV